MFLRADHRDSGADFEMLPLAQRKAMSIFAPVKSNPRPTFIGDRMRWINADALALPLANQSANILSIAFGIRNVSDPSAALKEFHRVLKPGGALLIVAEIYRGGKHLEGARKTIFEKHLAANMNLLTPDEHRELLTNVGFSDAEAFEEHDKGWICVVGRKSSEQRART